MEQVKRLGQALGGAPTSFDEEVEKHYQRHAANIAKEPTVPSDDGDNEQGSFDQQQNAQGQAIQNLAGGENPVNSSSEGKTDESSQDARLVRSR